MNSRRESYEHIWTEPTGIGKWFATVNNQPFGNRFMAASFIFFGLAGLMALLMRLQLAVPDNHLIGPSVYNQLFTMHGSTMMYLVVLPFLEGLAIYVLPVMLGSREMAFPKMSAFSFWVFFSGGLIFFSGFVLNAVPDAGWFAYPPLSSKKYSGLGLDFLLVGLGFIEIAGVGAGIEIVTTVLKFRAPGMSLAKMPLFAWAWLVTSVMIIFAFATLFGATVLIELDRAVGTRFFDPDGGGNVLLWQHLFWFFGHPDVYIMFIPATGMVSMIIPAFARRPIAGYTLIAVAIVVTGFLSFGLWVHHMFATGLPSLSAGFFVAASIMIALASGTQVFAWIATLWRSRPVIQTPLLYVLGFLFLFVFGGITGVMLAVLPFDLQAHDTHFVVGHLHYVLIGGVIFPIIGAIHYWMPLIIGRMPSERLGRWSFWLIFIGFNLTFLPMHVSGLKGMARRVYTYPESLGIGWLNMLSTIGSFVIGAGFALVAWNVFISRKRGEPERLNPWGSGSLEWSMKSDMPNYVFLRPPVVNSRDPLWEKTKPAKVNQELERISRELEAAPSEWRASLITDAVTGMPQAIQRVAGPSYIPFVAAMAFFLTSVATLASSYLLALGCLIVVVITVVFWLWPRKEEIELMSRSDLPARAGLPVMPTGAAASGWWVMVGTLAVIGTVFGVLFYSYYYLRLYSVEWPQGGILKPDPWMPAAIYALLPISLGPVLLAQRYLKKAKAIPCVVCYAVAALLGLLFMILIIRTSAQAEFSPQLNAYASIFHTMIWHVAALSLGGIVLLLATAFRIGTYVEGIRQGYVVLMTQVTSMFWRFTVVVGLLAWSALYLSPHVI